MGWSFRRHLSRRRTRRTPRFQPWREAKRERQPVRRPRLGSISVRGPRAARPSFSCGTCRVERARRRFEIPCSSVTPSFMASSFGVSFFSVRQHRGCPTRHSFLSAGLTLNPELTVGARGKTLEDRRPWRAVQPSAVRTCPGRLSPRSMVLLLAKSWIYRIARLRSTVDPGAQEVAGWEVQMR